MYTPGQVAKFLGTSGTTIRNYASEFSEFLSPSATPGPGVPRQFTQDDVSVLETIYIMRGQLAPPEKIVDALRAGDRLESDRPPVAADAPSEVVTGSFLTALTLLESRLDKAESRLEVERDARLAAELRAVAAETELRLLREAQAPIVDTPRPMSFREWWNSRRPK